MTRISTQFPDTLVVALDVAAADLQRSREQIVREAVQQYLEDFSDQAVALARLRDENDPELDWEGVKRELLDND